MIRKIRYLTTRPGAAGGPLRYFWQPKTALQALGWKPRRVPENWAAIAEPAALEAAAIAAAQGLNAELDAWRGGTAPAASSPAMIAPERTVNALITSYKASPRFARLALSSQRVYKQALEAIAAWSGDAPVREMSPPRFQRFYERMFAKTPGKANGTMRVAVQLFEHARREGWIAINPVAKIGLIDLDFSGRIWPREAVEAMVAMADELGYHSLGTAIVLDEWLGQRQADILKLPRNILSPAGIALRQGKTGAGIVLPVSTVPVLVARVRAELERQRSGIGANSLTATRLIVNEETGQAYNIDTFRHHFAIVRAALAKKRPSFATDYLVPGADPHAPDAFILKTEDLWYMHLRHTAVTRLAEAGCTVPEIASISGHKKKSVDQMLDRYLISTRALAVKAFGRRLEAETPAAEQEEQA